VLLRERAASSHANERQSPWTLLDGWRLSSSFRRRLQFLERDESCVVDVEYRASRFQMFIGGHRFDVDGELQPDGGLTATIDGLRMKATAVPGEDAHHLFFEGQPFVFRFLDPLASEADGGSHESSLLSPMPGLLTMLLAEPGAPVEKGTPLLVMEAMKMEYTIKAPAAGKVESFFFDVGDQVPEGTQLLRFEHDSE
jgi:3-methylcrotonyl-CoA carboxylase alpha subunit